MPSSRLTPRGLSVAVTALLAMALAAAVAGRGCQGETDGPSEAVRNFLNASALGDRTAMFSLLGPQTRKSLQKAAERATELVGGERRYEPKDMLQPIGGGPTAIRIASMGSEGNHASLSLTSRDGESSTVQAIRVDGSWKIELLGATEEPRGNEPPSEQGLAK